MFQCFEVNESLLKRQTFDLLRKMSPQCWLAEKDVTSMQIGWERYHLNADWLWKMLPQCWLADYWVDLVVVVFTNYFQRISQHRCSSFPAHRADGLHQKVRWLVDHNCHRLQPVILNISRLCELTISWPNRFSVIYTKICWNLTLFPISHFDFRLLRAVMHGDLETV